MFALCAASLSAATATVLAYRVVQLGVPALLGALASLGLRRLIRHRSDAGGDRRATRGPRITELG